MANDKLRRRIAVDAAGLIARHVETHVGRAKLLAARRIRGGYVRREDLPSDYEVRLQVAAHARLLEARRSAPEELSPRSLGLLGDLPSEPPSIVADGENSQPYSADLSGASSGPEPERVSNPCSDRDRFCTYRALLVPLAGVGRRSRQSVDELCHSLQVFDQLRDTAPYDEELMLAGLLHDIGKAIDPREHVKAALAALQDSITPRTAWLIEHHMEGLDLQSGGLGARARRRLESSEFYDDLVLLARSDRAGRDPRVEVTELDDALHYLEAVSRACDEPLDELAPDAEANSREHRQ